MTGAVETVTVRGRCGDCGRILTNGSSELCRYCSRDHLRGVPGQDEPDWVVVERLMAGKPVQATRAELQEALRRLNEKGLSAREIAKLVGLSERSVTRRRTGMRQAVRLPR